MRDVLIQGMRRNGTTILFDAFVRDPRYTTYYEPLNLVTDEPLPGGGSGTHQGDLYADLRAAQDRFLAGRPTLGRDDLHHGGPSRPEVEYDAGLPATIADYLAALLGDGRPWAAKFVRMGRRVETLHALAPDAVLAWPVRDPRAVARSYLLGRGGRTADRYPDADAVFTTVSEHNAWSVHRLSDALLTAMDAPPAGPLTDLDRVLLVWADAVATMQRDAPRWFGDRAVRVRHEDLCAHPDAVLGEIWRTAEADPDEAVAAWVRSVVAPPSPWEVAADARWPDRFERLGIAELVAGAGYAVD